MKSVNAYLSDYFVTHNELAQRCAISGEQLTNLVRNRLVMAPSYVVKSPNAISSFVFGMLECDDATVGDYYHPMAQKWVERALKIVATVGIENAHDEMRRTFCTNFEEALRKMDRSVWPLANCITDAGEVIRPKMQVRLDSAWTHFLAGTFGLCVTSPGSEEAIARKEVVQEKLVALSENGAKSVFNRGEANALLELIDQYDELCMPFSPAEFERSSRKRLVSDFKPKVLQALLKGVGRERGVPAAAF